MVEYVLTLCAVTYKIVSLRWRKCGYMDFSILVSNPLINVGVVSWALAQIIKTIIDFFKNRKFDSGRLSGAGGMPSSHAAVTSSVLLMSYYLYGFSSPVFALAFIFMFIVIYDSMGVRWAAGLHAKAINKIVDYIEKDDSELDKEQLKEYIPKLNESLGHRLIEVICGAILGFAVSIVTHFAF